MTTAPRPPVILMADDDADDRLLFRDALEESRFPHELRFVDDGEDLFDYLHQRGSHADHAQSPRPGLILLDLNMPRKDGRDVLRELKSDAHWRRIPVVVFTTSSAGADIDSVYDLGANSCITKPSSFTALVQAVQALGQYWFHIVELPSK